MKNSILKKCILWLFAIPVLFGCDDDQFLTENPETFYTIENVFTTSEQINQVLTSCYTQVRSIFCPYEDWDLAYYSYRMGNGTDMFDVPTIRFGTRFNDYSVLNAQSHAFYSVYSNFYYLINLANTALYATEKEDITWDSEADKTEKIAEARFFRAFAYRNLGELFGGVPIVTSITTTPRYDYTRSTRLETYQYAIDELEAILNDLPETSPQAGRLVRAAAQHNLCQLYIDKGVVLAESGGDAAGAYAKAVQYGNEVIDGGIYHLMTERFGTRKNDDPTFYFANIEADKAPETLYAAAGHPIEGNVYWDLFQEGNQDYQSGNKEAIWVVQIDYEVYKQEGGFGGRGLLYYPAYYGPVFRDQAGGLAIGIMEDVGGFGCCAVTPTLYTRDMIYQDQWGNDMRNSEAVFRRTILGNIKDTEYYGAPIPWEVLYKEDANGNKNDAATTQLYPISCKVGPDQYTGVADGQNRMRIFRDDYLIRLSETILLRAEAKMRSGDNAGAASDINILRSRAKCEYLVTAADVNLDLILDERARELVYEESRWNTLLRMGGTVAVDRIKEYAYWDYPRTTLTKTFNLWPIPQTVIDTNKDVKLEQNPGW
ncbi:MAG: RagB/SusD family nutrient uptake outer membrane protein [Proteiniphilum sp.]|uniref:RagB/SusD family nutrient uptake outer membrane protein n=1 Tax=Proteiniphilum sp. TaxID=1926877 RepID=UPI002AB99BD7|nr:RagB/SusD family nutrient uptake outer membrane protein [Proteiniphilum sp.]MDY9919207.1 RagB/SusD family nutrient uptake outer membrane protein [Proteiniphilum sp.]